MSGAWRVSLHENSEYAERYCFFTIMSDVVNPRKKEAAGITHLHSSIVVSVSSTHTLTFTEAIPTLLTW